MAKNDKRYGLLSSGILCLLGGTACLILEYRFYQYVDQEGVLLESLLLPLGMGTFVIGVILTAVYAVGRIRQWVSDS